MPPPMDAPHVWLVRDLAIPLEALEPDTEWSLLRQHAAGNLGIPENAVEQLSVVRESLDARKKDNMVMVYTLAVTTAARPGRHSRALPMPEAVRKQRPYGAFLADGTGQQSTRPIVVGAGPCGLFCALALAEAGLAPVLIERGQPVEQRRQDVMDYWTANRLHPESNVQFGEGGAGTFSDGKLTTRIHDPRCDHVLDTFVACGAPAHIRWQAKPHLGTDMLGPLLIRLRERLQALGTDIRFGTRVDGLLVREGKLRGVRLADGTVLEAETVVLAIGHSARDTFTWLHDMGIGMEPKPFSVGVRIEHPQSLVNAARYGDHVHYKLGPADYQLFEKFPDRTAYTFCMCPGGTVVAAASEARTIVTNGMSDSARQGGNANSAFVVSVDTRDYGPHPLDGVAFQRHLELQAFEAGGGAGAAPVQRLGDFLSGIRSDGPGTVRPTYTGDIRMARLDALLPRGVVQRMREAVPAFERRMHGFALPDAPLTGCETRTSSPVRILRNEKYCTPALHGLYPAGEGAGYAGGIMSAAVDGLRVAEAILGLSDAGI